LVGEAGIGKTRLVERLAARASHDDGVVLIGHAFASTEVQSFGPWIEIIRAGIATAGSTLVDGLGVSCRAQLGRLLPELGSGTAGGLSPFGTQRRLFDAVAEFLTGLASRRPLLLVLENLHWADQTSLRLLSAVSCCIGASPVLIVGTVRDSAASRMRTEILDELRRENRLQILSVAALPVAERLALVRALATPCPRPLPDSVLDPVQARFRIGG
jgi:predicted ATPase